MSTFKPPKSANGSASPSQKAGSGPNAERRAQALRDNLLKRKTQARVRAKSVETPEREPGK